MHFAPSSKDTEPKATIELTQSSLVANQGWFATKEDPFIRAFARHYLDLLAEFFRLLAQRLQFHLCPRHCVSRGRRSQRGVTAAPFLASHAQEKSPQGRLVRAECGRRLIASK